MVVTESVEMVAPADNTLEQKVSEETNAVDMVTLSHDDLLMVDEDGPTLAVDSLEELPATPLEEEDETEEDEDDVEDADMNVQVEPPGPKGTVATGASTNLVALSIFWKQ